jgi:hypothetical protein
VELLELRGIGVVVVRAAEVVEVVEVLGLGVGVGLGVVLTAAVVVVMLCIISTIIKSFGRFRAKLIPSTSKSSSSDVLKASCVTLMSPNTRTYTDSSAVHVPL